MDRNPFEYGRELGLDERVDRQQELATIAATIRNRGKLFVIGPRRFGKTSLLAAAETVASEAGVIVLRLDAEKYESLHLLVRAILTQAARSLKGPVEKVAALLREVAGRLRPEVSLDPVTGALSVGLGARVEAGSEVTLLGDALDVLEALAARSGREVVLILDEVQQVVVEHGETMERQLRATIQAHRHVAYVLAGSSTRLLTAMTTDPNRPFYRLGERLFVEEVPSPAFLAFLDARFRSSGFAPEAGTLEFLLEKADRVPYNVQRLAHGVWELLRVRGGRGFGPDAVEEALLQAIRREDAAYTQLWTSLTKNQKKALKAVIALSGRGLRSAEAALTFGLPPSSMHSALRSLEERHLVREVHQAGESSFRLIDPFLAAWLASVQAL